MRNLKAEDPNTCIIAKDINNARLRLNQEFLGGRTPIQALLMELPTDGKWLFRYVLSISIAMVSISIAMVSISIAIVSITNLDLDTI